MGCSLRLATVCSQRTRPESRRGRGASSVSILRPPPVVPVPTRAPCSTSANQSARIGSCRAAQQVEPTVAEITRGNHLARVVVCLLMRRLLLAACLVCAACVSTAEAPNPVATRATLTSAAAANPKAYDTFVSADFGDTTGGTCGLPRAKLAARFSPPREMNPGVWEFSGCIFSDGNVFYDVMVFLSFPDGASLSFPVLEKTSPTDEARFTFVVERASIREASARIYFNDRPARR